MASRAAILLLGLVIAAFGLLFLLQGLGVVRWPASSFMIDQTIWVVVGGLMLVAGGATLIRGNRRPL